MKFCEFAVGIDQSEYTSDDGEDENDNAEDEAKDQDEDEDEGEDRDEDEDENEGYDGHLLCFTEATAAAP